MNTRILGLSAAVLCAASMALPAQGQVSTAFTYQGMIEQSGTLANGDADFIFNLYGESTAGTVVAESQVHAGVPVVNGRFAVTLNFGSAPFTGDARWLEMAMRFPAGTGDYITLAPRQRIDPAPYAHKAVGVDSHSLDAGDGAPMDALFVSNTGNVGIGLLPFDKFHIRAGNSFVRVDSVNGDLRVSPSSSILGISNDSPMWDARIDFVVEGWPRMVITGAGNVGMGTINPATRLHVANANLFTAHIEGVANTYTGVDFTSSASAATWTLGVMGTAQGTNSGAMYLIRPGFGPTVYFALNNWVGLGKVPGFRLDLPNIANGDGRARANQWAVFSSARWKENVHTLDGALEKVMRLRGVSYDWKPEHGGAHDIGFVAEEVGKVVPEIVAWEANGVDAAGLAYDRVAALGVEAIKEQQKQIQRLQQTNTRLQQQIAQLKRLLAAN